jgi:hypothetical protein
VWGGGLRWVECYRWARQGSLSYRWAQGSDGFDISRNEMSLRLMAAISLILAQAGMPDSIHCLKRSTCSGGHAPSQGIEPFCNRVRMLGA